MALAGLSLPSVPTPDAQAAFVEDGDIVADVNTPAAIPLEALCALLL